MTLTTESTVYTFQARQGTFYTHLFETPDAPASLCGLDRSRFFLSYGSPSVTVALSGRSDVCGRCARVLRARVAS